MSPNIPMQRATHSVALEPRRTYGETWRLEFCCTSLSASCCAALQIVQHMLGRLTSSDEGCGLTVRCRRVAPAPDPAGLGSPCRPSTCVPAMKAEDFMYH